MGSGSTDVSWVIPTNGPQRQATAEGTEHKYAKHRALFNGCFSVQCEIPEAAIFCAARQIVLRGKEAGNKAQERIAASEPETSLKGNNQP
ncbi:hypothetical protein H634G_00412 [Metarhizium anisopliae BRIP 53293]|uniref:Uncharacterized protein n=1 Tax=Metarhizium anisopliae BRIP 53293 TaxID=1291518 RepID=A0A0D9PCS3_METAN|nr:hypothetical protein H634G_00412 [Metarhizium anisopliae BRIP 53293]KJK88979.1 hypothetical protein H633G_07169 [Metarhizium anisopliae BRIP 53284]